ncbi:MAG: hypothetical protein CM15mP128_0350 [Methanobacteriota archaeon]|nr:MAG: hypothetical protein CM15mP128_0350 [Euryarchaeota archaeon]
MPRALRGTVTFDVINPVPLIEVRIVEAWLNGSLVDASTPFDGDVGTVTLKRTFDDVGSVHASPGTLLYFDSDGTRDGDARFEGRLVPMEPASEDWNGLVEYVCGISVTVQPSPTPRRPGMPTTSPAITRSPSPCATLT